MRKKLFHITSRLGFHIALAAGLSIGLADIAISIFYYGALDSSALYHGLAFFGLSFFLVYLCIYALLFSRLESLNRISRNIAQKEFEDYESLSPQGRDELDYLVKQTIRASKTVEREIRRLNRMENYRKEFIGDISHELKTPIFAIQGFVETLLNGAIDDEEVNRKFLEKAMRSINRLILLTNDLIEISKLETGELKSDIREVYLWDVIMDVADSLQHKARKEGVTIITEGSDEDLMVRGDRNQLKQVLINLVENAIKYNRPEGSVTIDVKDYSRDDDRLLVYVQDTGIGIEPQFLDRVTERFFRIDKSRSRGKGGTGLGLAIVKHILEAHGEEFFVESTPGVGSTFSFTLTKADHPASL